MFRTIICFVVAWSQVLAEVGLDARLLVPARRLEEREARRRLPSGVAVIDALLGGGWPRGALTELVGPRSSGRTGLLLASIAGALGAGEAVALIDVDGGLDVRAARRAGVALDALLWVRCDARQALAAAEIVVGAGGFGLVAVDVGGPLRAPTAAWLRLKRTADRHGTALVVSASRRPDGAIGACALALAGRPRFRSARTTPCPAPPALLLGLDATVTLARGAHAANANGDAGETSTGEARPVALVR